MKSLFKFLAIIGVFIVNGTALAITVNDTNAGLLDAAEVGGVDTFLTVAKKVGSPEDEETWVNQVLAPNGTASYTVKLEPVTYYSTNATDTYAFSLLDTNPRPDYFLVKNATYMALFSNLAYVGWGVFDINDIVNENDEPVKINLGGDKFTISHVTLFESNGTKGICNPNIDPTCLSSVPVPPAVWLFGSGLIGLVAVSRRKPIANV